MCTGGKAPLPVRPFAGAGQAEPREQRHVEAQGGGHPGSRLEGKASLTLGLPSLRAPGRTVEGPSQPPHARCLQASH